MTQRSMKRMAWILFFIGAGGTILFFLLVAIEGWPPSIEWFIWPALSTIIAFVAGIKLNRAYKEEPDAGQGKWHISVADLIAISFFIAITLSVMQALLDKRLFQERGIPVGLLSGLSLLGGLLVASRKGLRGAIRYVFAVAYVVRLFCAFGIGGLITLLVVATFAGGNVFRFIGEMLGLAENPGPDWFLFLYFRISLLMILPSLLLCHLIERRAKDRSDNDDGKKARSISEAGSDALPYGRGSD